MGTWNYTRRPDDKKVQKGFNDLMALCVKVCDGDQKKAVQLYQSALADPKLRQELEKDNGREH